MTKIQRGSWRGVVLLLSSATGLIAAELEPMRFAADRPVDCRHIRIEVQVDLAGKQVQGRAVLDVVTLRAVDAIVLDAVEFEVRRTMVGWPGLASPPASMNPSHDGRQLTLAFDKTVPAGTAAQIVVEYLVDDPSDGLHFFSPSADDPDVPWVMWSQGQSLESAYWFPCFNHPNERQTTEVVVTTARRFQVSSNGRLVERREDADQDTVTVHWRQEEPHVAYLVSLVVGEFEIVREAWRGMPVEYWVHPGNAAEVPASFRHTRPMLDYFSDAIGVRYPWARYAQLCCHGFGGGMENTSATTLGTGTLHDARALLDGDASGLIAHELAHQWWGDLVTCRDWAHLWLNEGFATYFEALWDEHHAGVDEFQYNMMRKAERARRGGASRPIVDRAYQRPDDMFDARAYPKGAWVLHMVRRRIGDAAFWKVLNHYATTHAYGTVETVDFRKAIEAQTHRSFERFFHDWTDRPGHPEVTVSTTWRPTERLVEVVVEQTQDAAPFHFPLQVVFHLPGQRAPVTFAHHITQQKHTFYHSLGAAPVMVRVDPDLAVLMDLREKKSRGLWVEQLQSGVQVSDRLRAVVHFGESKSAADRKVLAAALATEPFWGVRREIAQELQRQRGSAAVAALIGGLQDSDARVRRACLAALAEFRDDADGRAAIRSVAIDGDASYDVESAALSALGRLERAAAIPVLTAALERPSRHDVLRAAALRGLGDTQSAAALQLVMTWAGPPHSSWARRAALGAVGSLAGDLNLEPEEWTPVVDVLAANLSSTSARVRAAAVGALGALPEPRVATHTLPVLDDMVEHDDSAFVRRAARRTADALRAGRPVAVQVDELRDTVDELLEDNKQLTDRLERLEERLNGAIDEPDGGEIDDPTPADGEEGVNS